MNIIFSAVVTNASWKYDFLPLTVCFVTPLVTTSLVNYSGGIIYTNVTSSRSLGSGNTNLTAFLAAIVDYQSRTTQSLTTNTIGDALYSIYVTTSGNNSSSNDDLNTLLLLEMVSFTRLICCPTERTSTVSGKVLAGCHRVHRNGSSFPFHPAKLNEPHPHSSSSDPHFRRTHALFRPRHRSL